MEAQQSEASDKSTSSRTKLSAEQAAAFREKENLLLSRRRVLQQLEATPNPRHRRMLEDSLLSLNEKLGRL